VFPFFEFVSKDGRLAGRASLLLCFGVVIEQRDVKRLPSIRFLIGHAPGSLLLSVGLERRSTKVGERALLFRWREPNH
jgi:hypothetical protein